MVFEALWLQGVQALELLGFWGFRFLRREVVGGGGWCGGGGGGPRHFEGGVVVHLAPPFAPTTRKFRSLNGSPPTLC